LKLNNLTEAKSLKNSSKLLSLILRHKPETVGITLDGQGWANVDELIDKINSNTDYNTSMEELEQVVASSDKQRFTFNDDKTKIRANQGHSIPVDLGLTSTKPPKTLYHGTALNNVKTIRKQGINRRNRQHVHLSSNIETATKVGQRHGKPVVLVIDSDRMYNDGLDFIISKNGVWLTHYVDPRYIIFAEG